MSSIHDSFHNSTDSRRSDPEPDSPFLNEELLFETARISPAGLASEPGLRIKSPFLEALEEKNIKFDGQDENENWNELNDEFTEDDLEFEDFRDLLLEQEVIGKDTRVLVRNTLDIPYRWICSLDLYYANGVLNRGTGILIGPRYVLTVAHALVSEKDGESVEKIVVVPARNGKQEPLGRTEAETWNVSQNWKAPYSRTWQYDYALITLKKDIASPKYPKLGNQSLGYWGHKTLGQGTIIKPLEPGFLSGKTIIVNIAGYPGDKCGNFPIKSDSNCSPIELQASTQWRAFGKIVEVNPDRSLIKHTIDTYQGQSGAPVWLRYKDRRNLIGIHARPADSIYQEKGDNYISKNNFAVRLTKENLTEIYSWMNADSKHKDNQEFEHEEHDFLMDEEEIGLESFSDESEDLEWGRSDIFLEQPDEDWEENLCFEDDGLDEFEALDIDETDESYQSFFDERDDEATIQYIDEQESGPDFEDQAYHHRRCRSYEACLNEAMSFRPSGFEVPVNKEGKYDKRNWHIKIRKNEYGRDEKMLVLKPNKTPSKAIEEIIKFGYLWTMDCAYFVQVIHLYALSQMNPEQFDRQWKDREFQLRQFRSSGAGMERILAIYRRGGFNRKKCQENKNEPWQRYYKKQLKLLDSTWNDEKILDSVPPGSRVMWSHEQGKSPWMNENTVKVGKDQYLAFGFGDKGRKPLTAKRIKYLIAENVLYNNSGRYQGKDAIEKDVSENVFLCEVVRFRRPNDDSNRR